jgi:hypothetical protein
MPIYTIRFSANLEGETSVEANDIGEAIERLDDQCFPRKILDDFSISSFYIELVSEV